MADKKVTEERVPGMLVAIGGLCFVFSLLLNSLGTAIIGILVGIHILRAYPHKSIHGIIPIVLNSIALVLILVIMVIWMFWMQSV
jgi:hypothetical protein